MPSSIARGATPIDPSTPPEAKKLPPPFAVYVVFSLVCAVLVALRPLNFLSDDSLFYLLIADHLSHGDGSTFNSLFATNGYHPLWECLAALVALLPHSKPSLLVYGVFVQWALGVATLWILMKALRPYLSAAAVTTFVAVLLIFFVPFGNLYWTEAPLSMLFVALMIGILVAATPVPYVALGVVLGLLFLSRLDNIFLIGCALAGLWWRDRDPRILITAAISAAIAGVYLCTNLAQFGHLMPISGAIKSAVYRKHFFGGQLGINGFISLFAALGLALINTASLTAHPRRYRLAMQTLSAGVILQSLYVVVMTYGETTWVWYYVQGYLCAAILIAELVDIAPRRAASSMAALALAGSVLLCSGVAGAKYLSGWSSHDSRSQGDSFDHWRDAWLADVERVLPDDRAVLVAFDQPGLFAYALSHPVFSLDGLTSNYRVDSLIAARGMYPEISSFGAAYFMGPLVQPGETTVASVTKLTGVAGGQIIHFASPLTGADAGCIYLDNTALLISRAVPSTLIGGVWGLWRMNSATMRQVTCPSAAPRF
jgi:hypothetical protein